jgi:hypothetical protein
MSTSRATRVTGTPLAIQARMRRLPQLGQMGIVAACAAVTACSFALRPFVFETNGHSITEFAGRWRGGYSIDGRPRRRGLIEFRIDAAKGAAAGNVLMTGHALIPIEWTESRAGIFQGNLAPYWDPDRRCLAWASFVGSRDGDVLAGTFISVCDPGGSVLQGRWEVVRQHR